MPKRLWQLTGIAGSLLAALPVCAQSVASDDTSRAQPYSLERSAVLDAVAPDGERYSVMVAWPEGDPPSSGWPVLYALDGEENFAIFALTARRFARAGARNGIAPGIVVGIGAGPLGRRVRDYTPPAPGYQIPSGRPATGLETGGSDAFLELLETRIMPLVRRGWRIDATRETLAGHSFGGLLAIHTMITRPAMFDRVVAVSPSFWFGNGFLVCEAASAGDIPRGTLTIVTGGAEKDAASDSAAFAGAFRKASPSSHIRQIELPGQSHRATMLVALPQAIAQAFGSEEP